MCEGGEIDRYRIVAHGSTLAGRPAAKVLSLTEQVLGQRHGYALLLLQAELNEEDDPKQPRALAPRAPDLFAHPAAKDSLFPAIDPSSELQSSLFRGRQSSWKWLKYAAFVARNPLRGFENFVSCRMPFSRETLAETCASCLR